MTATDFVYLWEQDKSCHHVTLARNRWIQRNCKTNRRWTVMMEPPCVWVNREAPGGVDIGLPYANCRRVFLREYVADWSEC
jgi:hypothetical protein